VAEFAVVARKPRSSVHEESHEQARQKPWFAAGLGALGLFALAIRLFGINHESLWLDEGYTLLFSRLPLPQLFIVGGAHEHPPLYYLVVHAVLSIHHAFLVPRIVSAVAGSLAVVALGLLGARLFTKETGLIAASLLAISPLHVWYGQDGRAYELAGLFVLLSYLTLVEAVHRPRRWVWIAFVLATLGALYTEYTTVLVLVPQALFWQEARRTDSVRSLLLSWFGVFLGFAPWLGVLAQDAASISTSYWIPTPTLDAVVTTILEFVGAVTPCTSPPCFGSSAGVPILAGHHVEVAMGAVGLVAVAALIAARQRSLRLILLLTWLIVPFAVVLLLAVRRSLYLDRVFLDATFPLYLLLAASAVAAWTKRTLKPILAPILIVAVLSIANLPAVYGTDGRPDWRPLAHDLGSAYRTGQAVIFYPGVVRPLVAAYLPGGWHATSDRSMWTRTYSDVPGFQAKFPPVHSPFVQVRYAAEAELRNWEMTKFTRGIRQVWLVTLDYSGETDTRRWLGTHGFHLLLSESYQLGGNRIELWDRGMPAELGPAVIPPGFGSGWSRVGSVTVHGGQATERGNAQLVRSFAVQPGDAYSANIEYRGMPPSRNYASIDAFDRNGKLLESFPHTKWYDLPVNGVWISQPLGFVAPPGAARAILRLHTFRGEGSWRNVAVYRER
jgi:mannosyltransferase